MNISINDPKYLAKVQKIYGDLNGDLHLVQIQRDGATSSLGLSLVGSKDVVTTMGVFIVGVRPSSVAATDGNIRVGDELLEVNNKVLYGRSHLNASAIIKGISSQRLKILLLRSVDCLQRMAVEPLQTTTPTECNDSSETLIPKKPKSNSMDENLRKNGNYQDDCEDDDDDDNDDEDFVPRLTTTSNDIVCQRLDEETSPAVVQIQTFGDNNNSKECNVTSSPLPVPTLSLFSCSEDTVDIDDDKIINETNAGSKPEITLLKVPEMTSSNTSENVEEELNGICCNVQTEEMKKNCEAVVTVETLKESSMQTSTTNDDPPTSRPITSNKPTLIEIQKGKLGVGIEVVGGLDTSLHSIFIYEIYKDGAVAKDGRLRVGDRILEVNGEDVTSSTHAESLQTLRRSTATSLRLLIVREERSFTDDMYDTFTIELMKKSGKGLGLSIVSKNDGTGGIIISDVVKGGAAEADGRLTAGDQILSVNGEDIQNATHEDAAKLLKTSIGKISLSISRLRVVPGKYSIHNMSSNNARPSEKGGGMKKSDSHTVSVKKNAGKNSAKSISMSKSY